MFKSFQNTSRTNGFNGFPALNFQMNNEAYGFSGCTFWLDAAYGTNTQTDLAAVSSWQSKIGLFSFNQSTAANQPRYNLSNSNFNNLPTIEFQDGGRKLYDRNGVAADLNTTAAWVAKVNGELVINNIAGLENLTGTTVNNAGYTMSGNNIAGPQSPGYLNDNNVFFGVSGTYRSLSPLIVIVTSSNIIINGGNQTTTGTATAPRFNIKCIGGSKEVSQNLVGLSGNIAEFILFNKKLSQTECETLSTRLNSKYAIY